MNLQLYKYMIDESKFVIDNLRIFINIMRFGLLEYEKKLKLFYKLTSLMRSNNSTSIDTIVLFGANNIDQFIHKYKFIYLIGNEMYCKKHSNITFIRFSFKHIKDPKFHKYVSSFIKDAIDSIRKTFVIYYDALYVPSIVRKDLHNYEMNIDCYNYSSILFKYVLVKYIRDVIMKEVITKDETYSSNIKAFNVLKRKYRVKNIESKTPNCSILSQYKRL